MKHLKTKKHNTPPQKRTPRTFTVELTEGEADFLMGLMASSYPYPTNGTNAYFQTPWKYAARLIPAFEKMTGHKTTASDAWKLSFGSVGFMGYKNLRWTR